MSRFRITACHRVGGKWINEHNEEYLGAAYEETFKSREEAQEARRALARTSRTMSLPAGTRYLVIEIPDRLCLPPVGPEARSALAVGARLACPAELASYARVSVEELPEDGIEYIPPRGGLS